MTDVSLKVRHFRPWLKFHISFFRNPHQPSAHHGQTGVGPVRVVQPSHGTRWARRSHQQEAVAGDHQGPQPALLHHLRRLHPEDAVSVFPSQLFQFLMRVVGNGFCITDDVTLGASKQVGITIRSAL